jgi:hypothetical protein
MEFKEQQIKEMTDFLDSFQAGDNSPGNEDDHYFGKVQPIDFIEDQDLGPHEANIVKYICRWQRKGGITDLLKVAWYTMRLIKLVQRREALAKKLSQPSTPPLPEASGPVIVREGPTRPSTAPKLGWP